jgi:hypothetical protein
MNARILGNAMAIQRRNDQKVASCARAKVEREWNHLVPVVKQCPPLSKPALVRLASKQLLKVLGLNAWGMGSVARDATSRMEKDEDLQGMILLWTDYKQVENYKTRQTLLIHQLVLIY